MFTSSLRSARAPSPDEPACAQAIVTTAALERLQPEWERLWSRAPLGTPFQSPHWLLPWWKHIGRGTLAAIALRCVATGELVGLAPLYVHVDASTRRRQLFPIGIATTDYLEPLVLPGWEAGATRAIASHLARHADEWDAVELPQLRGAAPLLEMDAPVGWRREILPGEPNPVLTLRGCAPGTSAEAVVPPPMAQNLRYCRRRVARDAPSLGFESADARTLPVFLDALARLHGRRWAERGMPGVLDDEPVRAAHREAAPRLHAAGLLRLYALHLHGEFVGAIYLLADPPSARERRWYSYIGGFDPRFRALSPGTLLLAHAIEQAIADAATAFDFLRGAEAYKYRWGAVDQPMFTLRLGRPDAIHHSRAELAASREGC